jgi:hypothetical protein
LVAEALDVVFAERVADLNFDQFVRHRAIGNAMRPTGE